MHAYLKEYPPASPGLAAQVEESFPYKTMPAEEYAAREGHRVLCFSYGNYVYANAELNDWIHTLDDIFFTPGALAAVRRMYLTPQEIAQQDQDDGT